MVMTLKPRKEEELFMEKEQKNENVWILHYASHLLFWSILFEAPWQLLLPLPHFNYLQDLVHSDCGVRQEELFFLYEVTARPPSIEWHDQGESASFFSSPLTAPPSAWLRIANGVSIEIRRPYDKGSAIAPVPPVLFSYSPSAIYLSIKNK